MIKVGLLIDSLSGTDGVANHVGHLIGYLHRKYPEITPILIVANADIHNKYALEGLPIIHIPELSYSTRSPQNFTRSVFHLRKLTRELGISVFHAHTHYLANIAYFSSRASHTRVVQTIHGIFPNEGILAHEKADYYILVNPALVPYMENKRITPDLYQVVRCGMEALPSSPDKHLSTPVTVLAAGRLIAEKGFDYYINAVQGLEAEIRRDCRFILAGKGPDETRLKQLISNYNIVEFIGEVDNLQEILVHSHIFVNPTRITTEGFPLTMIEAALTNNCIITTEFTNLRQDFTPGKDGLVCAMGDIESLQAALREAISSRELRISLSAAYSTKAVKLYNIDVMAEEIVKIYHKVCI
ncbi:MAG: glycosyltransferase family 4 protein [Ignavibacteria bacterium]|nr:glycosyltransferase family 4 protein [Ignavibacteria bacterium]